MIQRVLLKKYLSTEILCKFTKLLMYHKVFMAYQSSFAEILKHDISHSPKIIFKCFKQFNSDSL